MLLALCRRESVDIYPHVDDLDPASGPTSAASRALAASSTQNTAAADFNFAARGPHRSACRSGNPGPSVAPSPCIHRPCTLKLHVRPRDDAPRFPSINMARRAISPELLAKWTCTCLRLRLSISLTKTAACAR